ncbi:unnamed protein product [Toxocara canis]|uniref:SANT domain-containing protein n=1 Tax=Toxocara canis TaxID=6265 RepID=A0A183UFB5_TOXCA|nr:unnamed protein product [Toxocara canis]
MSSLCAYRNYAHRATLAATRPSEFSWFSVALKNLSDNSTASETSSPRPESVLHRQITSPNPSAPSDLPEKTCIPSKPVTSRLEFSPLVGKEAQLPAIVSPSGSCKFDAGTKEVLPENEMIPTSLRSAPPLPFVADTPSSTPTQLPTTAATSFASSQFGHSSSTVPKGVASSLPEHGAADTQRRSLTTKFLESKQQQNVVKTADVVHQIAQANNHRAEQLHTYENREVESTDDKKKTDVVKPSGMRPSPEGESGSSQPTELQIMLERFSKQRITDGEAFDSDLDSPIMHQPFPSMTAGDGNPVRHSLISLVMEEDVPMLMEAMAEKLNFVFEDLTSTPSSSNDGIIHDTAKRQQRRKMRNSYHHHRPRHVLYRIWNRRMHEATDLLYFLTFHVSKIDFVSTPPAVFTYPDETTALEHAEWRPGEHITFDQYQKICEIERERYEQEKRELSRWRASVLAARSIDPEAIGNDYTNFFDELF